MGVMNIVLTTDDNYIIPTIVTISSILSSANADEKFHIYILCAKELSRAGRKQITGIEAKYRQASVRFLEIDGAQLNLAVTTAYIPVASYYRLYISSLLPDDRCLFIDGDMIVKQDLTQIYNIDLEDYYAAGVKDLGVQCHFTEYQDYARYLGIPDMHTYVNAGFMTYNLKKMREDGIDKQMIDAINRGYKYMDQDIINKFCYGRIKLLPLKYDYFTEYFNSVTKEELSGYSARELEGIEHEIAVYHFVGIFKPWVCTRLEINQIWWAEAEKILETDVYEKIRVQAKEFERKSDWEYIARAAESRKQIVIFGCSQTGQRVAKGLQKGRDIVFADNDTDRIGTEVEGFPVLSAQEAYSKYPSALYIISSQNGFKQIGTQLEKLGIEKDNIIRYIHKDETYYRRLDERFMEHEKKQLKIWEQQ